jgi:hypothetical protein
VLVFHGIEGIGWEPISGEVIYSYFEYIKSKEEVIWVATFQDVTKYMRERMNAKVKYSKEGNKIRVNLSHNLNPSLYNLPLTLKTYVPPSWEEVTVNQGKRTMSPNIGKDEYGYYLLYEASPNSEETIIKVGKK